MTLNDPEILNGYFTLNFHYYEPLFSNYVTHLLYSQFTHVTSGDVRNRGRGPRSSEYLEFPDKLRTFRRRYIVEP